MYTCTLIPILTPHPLTYLQVIFGPSPTSVQSSSLWTVTNCVGEVSQRSGCGFISERLHPQSIMGHAQSVGEVDGTLVA